MNKLQEFLSKQDISTMTQTLNIGGRLKDFELTVKPLQGSQYNDYQKLCIENAASQKKRSFNTKKFNELIVINCTTEPNFKDADFQKANGVLDGDAAKLMYKVLLAGEISFLAESILKLSGFDRDIEEEMDEVKN